MPLETSNSLFILFFNDRADVSIERRILNDLFDLIDTPIVENKRHRMTKLCILMIAGHELSLSDITAWHRRVKTGGLMCTVNTAWRLLGKGKTPFILTDGNLHPVTEHVFDTTYAYTSHVHPVTNPRWRTLLSNAWFNYPAWMRQQEGDSIIIPPFFYWVCGMGYLFTVVVVVVV